MSTKFFIITTPATVRSINDNLGKAQVYYAGGDITNPDGTTFYSDGSVGFADGRVVDANGTTHYPDGSIKMPNGITYYANGIIEYPSGMKVDSSGQVINEVASGIDLTTLNQDDGVWDYDPYTDSWKFKILDANGNMLRIYYNCWIHKHNDKGKDSWYAVDEDGNMIVGFAKYNGDYYYFSPKSDSRGELITGEIIIAGRTYVFDKNGAMIKGEPTSKHFPVIGKNNHITRVDGYWKTGIDGKRSFLIYKNVPGVLRATEIATGWMLIDGYYYYLDDEGIPETGLKIYDNKYYYLERDGRMLEGGIKYINGCTYTFDKATGACLTIK